MNLPNEIQTAINKLNAAGYEAYAVGGCVRDMLLGLEPKDYDITTNALPGQVKELFSEYPVLGFGMVHGTVMVFINAMAIEITTYRSDGTYSDNRRPDYVTFTASLKEDVLRRDFTVNAMCYNPKTGVVDLCGSREDLKNRILRTVGIPAERFKEDSLRILRALRFASVYGFEIEAETAKAILKYKHLLKNVASERISVEINKLLCGGNVYRILMDFYPVFLEIFPEFEGAKGFLQHSPYHVYDIWEHTAVALKNAPEDPTVRLAVLLHDIGKLQTFSLAENGIGHFYNHANVSAELALDIMNRLKFPIKMRQEVYTLVKYHDLVINNDEVQIKRLLRKHGKKLFWDMLAIKRADTLAQSPELVTRLKTVNDIEITARKILEQQQCFCIKNLAVNGNDIMGLGYKGKRVGEILNLLLENVIVNNLPNSKEKLLEYVKDLHI